MEYLLSCIDRAGNYGHLHMVCITAALAIITETDCPAPTSSAGWLAFPPAFLHVACPAPAATWIGLALRMLWGAVGLAAGLCYVAISAVPFAMNFHGLVLLKVRNRSTYFKLLLCRPSLQVSPPYWDKLEDWFSTAQRLHAVGYYNLFASVSHCATSLGYLMHLFAAGCR
jgi:hypothetical protein